MGSYSHARACLACVNFIDDRSNIYTAARVQSPVLSRPKVNVAGRRGAGHLQFSFSPPEHACRSPQMSVSSEVPPQLTSGSRQFLRASLTAAEQSVYGRDF